MTRRYVNLSLVYALLGMAAGVFYREYTKFSGFAGQTSLGFMHAHYLVLGMAMFLPLSFRLFHTLDPSLEATTISFFI